MGAAVPEPAPESLPEAGCVGLGVPGGSLQRVPAKKGELPSQHPCNATRANAAHRRLNLVMVIPPGLLTRGTRGSDWPFYPPEARRARPRNVSKRPQAPMARSQWLQLFGPCSQVGRQSERSDRSDRGAAEPCSRAAAWSRGVAEPRSRAAAGRRGKAWSRTRSRGARNHAQLHRCMRTYDSPARGLRHRNARAEAREHCATALRLGHAARSTLASSLLVALDCGGAVAGANAARRFWISSRNAGSATIASRARSRPWPMLVFSNE